MLHKVRKLSQIGPNVYSDVLSWANVAAHFSFARLQICSFPFNFLAAAAKNQISTNRLKEKVTVKAVGVKEMEVKAKELEEQISKRDVNVRNKSKIKLELVSKNAFKLNNQVSNSQLQTKINISIKAVFKAALFI